jgi:hypothetical protein
MNKERAITYSLLSHIRNKGTLIKGPLDIFKPLVQRIISRMNSKGIFSGKSIYEIKIEFDNEYKIDIPIPVLNTILHQIAKEVNTKDKTVFAIHNDHSFSISEYVFLDYDNEIIERQSIVDEIENLFQKFCETSDFKIQEKNSIFQFIEKNKYSLSSYLSNNTIQIDKDFTAEAQFVKFFRNIPEIYKQIKDIYIGSIISGYIQYNPSETKLEVELIFDTNFIVGLLDLNTPESTHTCNTLLQIAKNQKYKIRVLKDTIEETKNLLEQKAKHFDKSFLQRKVYPEDIYNACDRKGYNKNDIERISDNLENEISKLGISIINDVKIKNDAKFSEEYKILKEYRNSEISALHDATAINYVKKVRGKKIKDFDKVNCWFVNNVTSREYNGFNIKSDFQPEIINADNLLNILWLSNPQTKINIDANDLADISLTSSIAITLNKDLPKAKILRELDDNIHKYASESLSDTDIVRIATRITNKQLDDLENLNNIANTKKEEFVKRLEDEANKQKKIEEVRIKKLEYILKEFSEKSNEFQKKTKQIESTELRNSKTIENLQLQNDNLIERLIDQKLKSWQRQSIYLLISMYVILLFILLFVLYLNDWSFENISGYITYKSNVFYNIIVWTIAILINVFGFRMVYDRYFNHSNINNKRSSIRIKI